MPPQAVARAAVDRRYAPADHRRARPARAHRARASGPTARRARYDPRIEKVIVTLADETKQVRIANSGGRPGRGRPAALLDPRLGDRRREAACGARAARAAAAGIGPEFFDEKPPEHFAREAARMAITLLGREEAPAGPMPVVLGPGWPGILLHEAVGHGLEGDFNRKGTSAFSGASASAWPRRASPWSTTASIPDRRGSLNVDDEGNVPGRTVLIEDGILRGYLQDRLNSGLMKMAATGNGRRQGYALDPHAAHDQHRSCWPARTTPRTSSAPCRAASTPSTSAAGRWTSPAASSCSRPPRPTYHRLPPIHSCRWLKHKHDGFRHSEDSVHVLQVLYITDNRLLININDRH